MPNLVNFVLFQLVWFAAVGGAGRGWMWFGPLAAAAFVLVHLRLCPGPARRSELVYLVAVGLVGTLLDTLFHALGVTSYPTSAEAWPYLVVPPWIVSLWVAFAALPRFSLGWLAGHTLLAILFGAIGGPLSYLGGTRFGAVGVGEPPIWTWGGLALEYAVLTPLLLRFAPAHRPSVPASLARRAQRA